MPTTPLKNLIYRTLLPAFSPRCSRRPVSEVTGHALMTPSSLVRLYRKHHVLGSATLLSSGQISSVICSSSDRPFHIARPETYFRVASITKIASAVLVMRFSDQGILSLDASSGQYFRESEAAEALDGITLRHLLSHTSGIIDPPDLEKSVESGRPFTEILPAARKYAPGSSFHYSNLGFGLVGCILESVMCRPVGTVFADRLFRPLGMNATLEGCLLPRDRIMPVVRVFPWHPERELILTAAGSRPLTEADPLRHYGHTAGSMYTDIGSLHRLLQVLIGQGNGFLLDSSVVEMKTKHASYGSLSPTLSYALGLLLIRDPELSAGRILGHQGFAYGCADGAFWEENTGRVMITLNGGCSEARTGRLGLANRDFMRWAFRKELIRW